MNINIAINGFGRIGRSIVRALYESKYHNTINIVAINEIADTASMAYLLKYDSSYGQFSWDVRWENKKLFINKDQIQILHEKEIRNLPWYKFNVDIVLDCTGIYGNRDDGKAHLIAGAKKVLFSHPGSNDLDNTIVYGVNHNELLAEQCIISNASCTINCILPIIKIIDEVWEIESGTITTMHSVMNDQQVIDNYHTDLRRSRAANQSIIPVETKLASVITRILPKFKNCFEAIAVRVPTINVTAIDLNTVVKKPAKKRDVNELLRKSAENSFYGIINYTELPLVSIDFNHNPHSAIVDGTQTRVSGSRLIKILTWCDNEWGFANRMIDTALVMALKGFK